MSSINPVKKFLEQKLKPQLDPNQDAKMIKYTVELKRKEFAEKSGIPYSTVNRLLSKDYLSPNIITIIAIARYFGCGIDEVVGRTVRHQGIEKLSPDIRDEVKFIGEGLKQSVLSKVTNNPSNSPKPLSQVEKLAQRQKNSTTRIR